MCSVFIILSDMAALAIYLYNIYTHRQLFNDLCDKANFKK